MSQLDLSKLVKLTENSSENTGSANHLEETAANKEKAEAEQNQPKLDLDLLARLQKQNDMNSLMSMLSNNSMANRSALQRQVDQLNQNPLQALSALQVAASQHSQVTNQTIGSTTQHNNHNHAMSSLLPFKIDRPVYSTPPPCESNPQNNECHMTIVMDHNVAAFNINNDEYICLPQVFDYFLKNLVGGLHTVYTKLKRLNITPLVCNVEQVRTLRALGAIQPGVNRCKLITKTDFESLYHDCTTSNARPGRPPKRFNTFGLVGGGEGTGTGSQGQGEEPSSPSPPSLLNASFMRMNSIANSSSTPKNNNPMALNIDTGNTSHAASLGSQKNELTTANAAGLNLLASLQALKNGNQQNNIGQLNQLQQYLLLRNVQEQQQRQTQQQIFTAKTESEKPVSLLTTIDHLKKEEANSTEINTSQATISIENKLSELIKNVENKKQPQEKKDEAQLKKIEKLPKENHRKTPPILNFIDNSQQNSESLEAAVDSLNNSINLFQSLFETINQSNSNLVMNLNNLQKESHMATKKFNFYKVKSQFLDRKNKKLVAENRRLRRILQTKNEQSQEKDQEMENKRIQNGSAIGGWSLRKRKLTGQENQEISENLEEKKMRVENEAE